MESVSDNSFKVLSMDEINKLNEEEAREYLINMLNSIPGLKYGHIYNKNEKIYMRNEYNKLKSERLKQGINTETVYETKLRYHLSLHLPDNTTETISNDLKYRVEFPTDIVSKWAIYHNNN